MRKSFVQPPHQHSQQQGGFSDVKKRKEEISGTNLRGEIRNPAAPISSSSSSSSAAAHGAGAEKKLELSLAAETETMKLERKSTEDINASADAFIKNFRQQLLIQRLESIENYEQMLARGL